MKYEWRKEEKKFYGAKEKAEILEIPKQQFIMIDGIGNPNEKDFTVYPLEGVWKKLEEEKLDKNKLKYTIMIKQPDFITQKNFNDALEVVKKRKPSILYDEIYFNSLEEGKSIQVLHIGSYDDEPISFGKMEELMNKLNLVRASDYHREVYLNNKNRTSTDKLKTILRYSVK